VSSYYDEQNENIKLPILIEFFGFIGAQDGVTQVNESNDDNATSTTHYRAFSAYPWLSARTVNSQWL
jgi:hypothetical protein